MLVPKIHSFLANDEEDRRFPSPLRSMSTSFSKTSSGNNGSHNNKANKSPLPRLVADDAQLKVALRAFEYAHYARLGPNWAERYYSYFIDAGIDSMNALLAGCKEDTINLDLDFIGVSPNDRIDATTIQYLINFLPGPVGIRCFRLAQMAAEKVRRGEADVKYVHRPENGNAGNELWHVIPHTSNSNSRHNSSSNTPLHSRQNSFGAPSLTLSSTSTLPTYLYALNQLLLKEQEETPAPQWTLHVDCAGFVRSVLKHITKDVVQVSLSDRSFMRAKDFYRFFETLDRTVTDREDLPLEAQFGDKIKKWRLITDLRMVIPGDIIVYRPKGNAAGGAAFTTNDRSDLKHLLKAVKMALLYKQEMDLHGPKHLVTRNLGRDPSVKPFVDNNRAKLDAIGIQSCRHLREHFDTLNHRLQEAGYEPFDETCLQLMKECSVTTAKNTGHIVFASGSAILMDDFGDYRIKVVHSTKNGVNQTQGVQQYYRRFQLREGPDGPKWTRIAPEHTNVASTVSNKSSLVNKPASTNHTDICVHPSNCNNNDSQFQETVSNCDTFDTRDTLGTTDHVTNTINSQTRSQSKHIQQCTSTGECSNEQQQSSQTTLTSINPVKKNINSSSLVIHGQDEDEDDVGNDNNDDEDVDVDDPEDQDTLTKNEHDVPENDVPESDVPENDDANSDVSDVVGDDLNEDIVTNHLDHDLQNKLKGRGRKARKNYDVINTSNDELAGLEDVEVLAARMCF